MKMSETIKEITAALAKAQGQMENAVKDSANPFFKSRYADLTSVRGACIKALNDNGISVVQPVYSKDDIHYVETLLLHSSGEWLSSGEIKLVLSKPDMQALGSAITYARRYQLQSMVCLSAEDDDGNAASGHTGSTTSIAPKDQSKPSYESPSVSPVEMANLVNTAKTNGYTKDDLRNYMATLGYSVIGDNIPTLTKTDYKDVLKHFSAKKGDK